MSGAIEPGRVVATPGALAALEAARRTAPEFINRHLSGDWGEHGTFDAVELTDRERQLGCMATSDDGKLNRLAVEANDGSRVMSRYTLDDGTTLWVATQGTGSQRHTVVTLPSEY